MKQLLLCLLYSSFTIAYAQTNTPFWSLAGNKNVSANSKLGTTNWNPLRLFTNNLERMRVSSGGNVGVGTTAPAQKLDVAGNLNIQSGFGLYLDNRKFLSTPESENFYFGYQAGENSEGTDNLFIGTRAGQNGGGFHNTIIGFEAGMNNSGANNTFCGYQSGKSNTTGTYNTFYGLITGFNNTEGDGNSVFGQNVLSTNVSGSWNCSFGFEAGNQTTTSENCFFGKRAGHTNETGFANTFIGFHADANDADYVNSTSIGHTSLITASNQVRIGNSSVTSIGGFTDWTNISDGRLKQNIKYNSVPGLEFIKELQPVTYNLNLAVHSQAAARVENTAANSKEKVVYTGFIAQEVEMAAKKIGFDFSGVDVPKNDKDYYGLRYAQFVVPLVKAVQQLDSANTAKDEKISKLEEELLELKTLVMDFNNGRFNSDKAWMKQNVPNPASVSTTIQYFVPGEIRTARIIVTNELGQQVNVFTVAGSGSVNLSTATLPSGTYHYSLIADNKSLITKKLVIAR